MSTSPTPVTPTCSAHTYVPAATRYEDVPYRRCGSSGIMLPPISLGLWKNFGATDDFKNSLHMLHTAFDHGITHFDLANNYGPPYGSAELTLGRAIEVSFRPYRDELFISTKAGYDMWPGPYGNWGSRKYLMASLNQSLHRMHLDYVDLFYIHRYDPHTPLDETLQALVDIVRAGKALYVGISRWPLEAARYGFSYLAAHDIHCLAYQGRINLIDRAPIEEGILPLCRDNKVGFVSFSPLAQGLLTGKYQPGHVPTHSRMALGQTLRPEALTPAVWQRLVALNDWSLAHHMALATLALRWVLTVEGVSSAIIGAHSTPQLLANLEAAQAGALSQDEWQEINRILQQYPI